MEIYAGNSYRELFNELCMFKSWSIINIATIILWLRCPDISASISIENVEGFMTNCLRILKFNGYSLVFDISFKYHVFVTIKSSISDPISQQWIMLFTIYSKTVAP